MKVDEFKFQIVTPMFLGGADQQAEGIRPASIKGALRFWWRALNWARCWQASEKDDVRALRLLHAEEARLFGLAAGWDEKAKTTTGGQGVFLMSVSIDANAIRATSKSAKEIFSDFENGHIYLLGLGLAKYDKATKQTLIQRNAIKNGGMFTLNLMFRPKTSENDMQQVRDAIRAFELLGALGSRARHGLGSVASATTMSRVEYVKAVQALLQPTLCATDEPPFTAFSNHTRVDISAADKNALNLLNVVGCEQQLYRSFGLNGMVNNRPAERNFVPDHNTLLDALDGKTPHQAPKRIVFGLPHNYFFSARREIKPAKGKIEVNYVADEEAGRRASPLLLHIHPVSEGGFLAVHTLIRACFLPENKNVQIRVKVKEYPPQYKIWDLDANPDWEKLRTYLKRFIDKTEGKVIHGG